MSISEDFRRFFKIDRRVSESRRYHFDHLQNCPTISEGRRIFYAMAEDLR